MRTALFTGAGASCAIGYPLTSDFLPRVRAELKSGELFADTNSEVEDRQDREELQKYLVGLFPGFDLVPDAKLPLITDVFSLVEYAIVSGETLPIGGDSALRRFRDLLKQAITDILVGDFLKPWDHSDPDQRRQHEALARFSSWVKQQGDGLGIVTTNYDIGLEYEVYEHIGRENVCTRVDLGFDWRDAGSDVERTRPAAPALRVFKLHGSLDVLRCRLCGYVYFNPWGAIAIQPFVRELSDSNTCICGDDSRLELHIVSPSLVREVREANLLSVWRSAMEWMRRAEHWVIVGYSLPPEDLAVRSLLLRAYAAAPRPPRITVVQRGEAARAAYELLFPDCEYEAGGLEGFLAHTA